MLQEGVEHERADARGRIDADQIGSENVRKQVRFRKQLRIASIHLKKIIDEVRLPTGSPFRSMRVQYPFIGGGRPIPL